MTMTIAIWVAAISMGVAVWRRSGKEQVVADLRAAGSQAAQILPKVVMVLLVAGFVVELLPPGLIAEHIGPQSGFRGVFYAAFLGIFIPGGASIAFSTVIVLADAGTGPVQLVTLLTSWSVFAVHRVFIYEIPMMGLRFAVIRLLVSIPLPFIAAAGAAALFSLLRSAG